LPPAQPPAAIFGVDANWQIQNAFEYYMRERKPGVAWFTTDRLPWFSMGNTAGRFQRLVEANAEIGREVVVSPEVYRKLRAAGYDGGATDPRPLENPGAPGDLFSIRVRSVEAGTPYALAILRPVQEYPLDAAALDSAWTWLTGGTVDLPETRNFMAVVGRVGERPVLVEASERPFRARARVEPFELDVRMESWLPTDTIRRAGFGHVIVGRRHMLTLERGLSFIALGPGREPAYTSGIFAPIPRYILGMRGRQ
jgi:hypothetical protein